MGLGFQPSIDSRPDKSFRRFPARPAAVPKAAILPAARRGPAGNLRTVPFDIGRTGPAGWPSAMGGIVVGKRGSRVAVAMTRA